MKMIVALLTLGLMLATPPTAQAFKEVEPGKPNPATTQATKMGPHVLQKSKTKAKKPVPEPKKGLATPGCEKGLATPGC